MLGAGRMLKARLATIAICAFTTAASPGSAADITSATYTEPTTRYQHGVLGDTIEYGAVELLLSDGSGVTIRLLSSRVFEDLQPRLVDVDNDGNSEVIVVESSLTLGARLSSYDENGLVASTPYIGQSHRWLAPIGAADIDGDGHVEIAYIDRPHLAKRLRIWRFKDNDLFHVADLDGLTNHRIGWDHIPGGIRDCGTGEEIITASADWSEIISTRLSATGDLTKTSISKYSGPESLNAALSCP